MHPNTSPAANKFVHIIHLHDTALCVLVLDLRAEDYAVIDRAVVGFGIGVNLMTGETGAGKSQLIDALEMLLNESIHLHNFYTAKQAVYLQENQRFLKINSPAQNVRLYS